jgi:hypothetical protein
MEVLILTLIIGEWEHIVVSNIKKVIPESVKQAWHEWRTSMKKAEQDVTGSGEVSEKVEMAGWGVEEAQQANKRDASAYNNSSQVCICWC